MFKSKRGLTIQFFYCGKENGHLIFHQNSDEMSFDGKKVKYSKIKDYADNIIEIINTWEYDHFDENITQEELEKGIETFYITLDEAKIRRRKNKEQGIEGEKPEFTYTVVVVGNGLCNNKTYAFYDNYPKNYGEVLNIVDDIRKHLEQKNENADE